MVDLVLDPTGGGQGGQENVNAGATLPGVATIDAIICPHRIFGPTPVVTKFVKLEHCRDSESCAFELKWTGNEGNATTKYKIEWKLAADTEYTGKSLGYTVAGGNVICKFNPYAGHQNRVYDSILDLPSGQTIDVRARVWNDTQRYDEAFLTIATLEAPAPPTGNMPSDFGTQQPNRGCSNGRHLRDPGDLTSGFIDEDNEFLFSTAVPPGAPGGWSRILRVDYDADTWTDRTGTVHVDSNPLPAAIKASTVGDVIYLRGTSTGKALKPGWSSSSGWCSWGGRPITGVGIMTDPAWKAANGQATIRTELAFASGGGGVNGFHLKDVILFANSTRASVMVFGNHAIGLVSIYDCTFAAVDTNYKGYGTRWNVRGQGTAQYDFRRNRMRRAFEHNFYVDSPGSLSGEGSMFLDNYFPSTPTTTGPAHTGGTSIQIEGRLDSDNAANAHGPGRGPLLIRNHQSRTALGNWGGQALSIWGQHGDVTVEDCFLTGDEGPLEDLGCMLFGDDRGKGMAYMADGFSTGIVTVRNCTLRYPDAGRTMIELRGSVREVHFYGDPQGIFDWQTNKTAISIYVIGAQDGLGLVVVHSPDPSNLPGASLGNNGLFTKWIGPLWSQYRDLTAPEMAQLSVNNGGWRFQKNGVPLCVPEFDDFVTLAGLNGRSSILADISPTSPPSGAATATIGGSAAIDADLVNSVRPKTLIGTRIKGTSDVIGTMDIIATVTLFMGADLDGSASVDADIDEVPKTSMGTRIRGTSSVDATIEAVASITLMSAPLLGASTVVATLGTTALVSSMTGSASLIPNLTVVGEPTTPMVATLDGVSALSADGAAIPLMSTTLVGVASISATPSIVVTVVVAGASVTGGSSVTGDMQSSPVWTQIGASLDGLSSVTAQLDTALAEAGATLAGSSSIAAQPSVTAFPAYMHSTAAGSAALTAFLREVPIMGIGQYSASTSTRRLFQYAEHANAYGRVYQPTTPNGKVLLRVRPELTGTPYRLVSRRDPHVGEADSELPDTFYDAGWTVVNIDVPLGGAFDFDAQVGAPVTFPEVYQLIGRAVQYVRDNFDDVAMFPNGAIDPTKVVLYSTDQGAWSALMSSWTPTDWGMFPTTPAHMPVRDPWTYTASHKPSAMIVEGACLNWMLVDAAALFNVSAAAGLPDTTVPISRSSNLVTATTTGLPGTVGTDPYGFGTLTRSTLRRASPWFLLSAEYAENAQVPVYGVYETTTKFATAPVQPTSFATPDPDDAVVTGLTGIADPYWAHALTVELTRQGVQSKVVGGDPARPGYIAKPATDALLAADVIDNLGDWGI